MLDNPTTTTPRQEEVLAVAGTLALFTYLYLANSWVGDDAYIAFRVVDNFVNGYGLRWNTVERVQAFTDPLWVLFLSPFYAVTREIFYTSLAVSFALCVAALAIGKLALGRIDRWILLVAILCSSKAFIDYTSSGLEYPLLYVLVAALYPGLGRFDDLAAPASDRQAFSFTFLSALAFVCRIDAIVLFVPALLWLAWVRVRAHGLAGLAPMLLGGLPAFGWLAFSIVYYGFPFPNTYYAKASAGFPAGFQARQGAAYLLNSLRFDPVTLVVVGAAVGLAARGSRRQRLVALAALLNVLYVVWVGGDFMSGRFFAPVFLLCALSVAAVVSTRATLAGCLVLLVSYNVVWPYVPAKTTANYVMAWPWRTQNGIKDERGGYHASTNLLFFAPFAPRPDNIWARDGHSLRMHPDRVFVRPSIGLAGYLGGAEKYLIDSNGLSDPLLAHLPVDESIYFEFNISHFARPMPAGYVESRLAGKNLVEDPLIRDYFERILRITTGPLWSAARFRDILALNVGKYRHFQRLVGARHQINLSIRAENPRFTTDVGELDTALGQLRSTGRAGLLQMGPGIPLRAGVYEAEWTGTVGGASKSALGFVTVCHRSCTETLATVPVESAGYRDSSRTIATVRFRLLQAVSDLEYRFFVNEGASVVLERIGLRGGPVQ